MKVLKVLIVLLLVFSLTGCSLLICAGIGTGVYFLVKNLIDTYKDGIYFADFWAKAAEPIVLEITKQLNDKITSDVPSVIAGDFSSKLGEQTIIKSFPLDFPKIVGTFATYATTGNKMMCSIEVIVTIAADASYTVKSSTFELDGTVDISDHNAEYADLSQSTPGEMHFDKVGMSADIKKKTAAFTSGKVTVGNFVLDDVTKFNELIVAFGDLQGAM